MTMVRAAGSILIALSLASCAGGGSLGGSAALAPDSGMAGRWMLAAPNVPTCGMNFAGSPGAREGSVSPEGGCPGRFFTSRRWSLEHDVLMISDDENQPLAQFKMTSPVHFQGRSQTGQDLTLSRQGP